MIQQTFVHDSSLQIYQISQTLKEYNVSFI